MKSLRGSSASGTSRAVSNALLVAVALLSSLLVGFQLGASIGYGKPLLAAARVTAADSYDDAPIIAQQEQENTDSSTHRDLTRSSDCDCNNNNKSLQLRRQGDFDLAFRESLGFFRDIPSSEWNRLRKITLKRINYLVANQPSRLRPSTWTVKDPHRWYQHAFQPDFSCRHEIKVGVVIGKGDGGKWVCDPHRIADMYYNNTSKCLVYSIGSNGNFDFEIGLQKVLGFGVCEIHTFDFGNYHGSAPKNNPEITFHQWGLRSSYNESASRIEIDDPNFGQLGTPQNSRTLQETMRILGHENRTIDIFKIDCEGCEWGTFKDWLAQDLRQILVEVHHVPRIAGEFFERLQRAGYVTFHKEPNTAWGGGCLEYSFLKLHQDYVENRVWKG